MALFGPFQVQLDPWDAEYGSELPLDASAEQPSDEGVDPGVEVSGTWSPIVPPPRPLSRRLVFVDGVRRLDARLLVRDGDRVVHGALGSFGVGTVVVEGGEATWGDLVTDRVAVTAAGLLLPAPIHVGPALTFRPVSCADSDPDAPLKEVHNQMRACEESVAKEVAEGDETLVVLDGPLTFEAKSRGRAVGLVKRIHTLYVATEHLAVLRVLPAASRSPVFAVTSSRRFERYSWFVRLAAPAPGESDLVGLVRLEVAASVGLDAACELADATTAALPRFSPPRARDPRSPQNLLPVGALEAQLRRTLGDRRLIRNRIRSLLARESTHAV